VTSSLFDGEPFRRIDWIRAANVPVTFAEIFHFNPPVRFLSLSSLV